MEQLASGGLPLGIMADADFREGRTRLYPGDIIAAGSMRDGPYVAGDVVELEFAGIGVLRNRVVRP